MLTTALIYTRVSTDDQAQEGVSLAAQLAEGRHYAALLYASACGWQPPAGAESPGSRLS
jgi:hypothetical protein